MSAPEIRWIVLSDLHLGERNSLLTPLDRRTGEVDPSAPAPALDALGAALRTVVAPQRGRRPTLVLLGDILGLAFGSLDRTVATFERMIEAVLVPVDQVCDRILFVPGNHDHHLWELARAEAYRRELEASPVDGPLPIVRHTTATNPEATIPSGLLGAAIRRVSGGGCPVDVVYPDLVLGSGGEREVFFHHGHFFEDVYRFVTRARRSFFPDRPAPASVEELERQNFAWIEFVWSAIGRSGAAGRDVEDVFRALRNPDELRVWIDDLVDRLAGAMDLPYLPGEALEEIVLRQVVGDVADRLRGERYRRGEALSERTLGRLLDYVFRLERGTAAPRWRPGADLTVVFGHTHKPFERSLAHPAARGTVSLVNTGGWTLDRDRPSPVHGGSVGLVSDGLDVVSLRIWNDGVEGRVADPEVSRAISERGAGFAAAVERRVRPGGEPTQAWRHLGEALEREIGRRRRRRALPGIGA